MSAMKGFGLFLLAASVLVAVVAKEPSTGLLVAIWITLIAIYLQIDAVGGGK